MEILRGKADVGGYHLKSEFRDCTLTTEEIHNVDNIISQKIL